MRRTTGDGAGIRDVVAAGGALDSATLTGLAELGLGRQPLPRLEAMVAAHLRRPRVHVLTARLQTYPYDRPALTTAGRYLVSGTAADEAGQKLTYSFFVKVVQAWLRSPLSAAVPEPLRSELAPLMPWRTEPDIYRGELGRHLPDGLGLPHAYHVTDLDDESAAVWLDRVPVRHVQWDVAHHRRAAYLLGRLASSTSVKPFAAHVPVGRTARGFAEHWLAVNVIPDLTSEDLWRQPNVAATFDPQLRRRILRAAAALPALVGELESLPTTTAHGDACTDNLLHTELSDDIVLIDFGFWGTAPVGFDLGQLVLGEIQLGRRPARAFPELEEACLPAYVQGLRDEGCTTPVHQVRRAHAIAMTIFHAIPSIPYEHRTAEGGPDLLPLFANRAAMAGLILDLLDATQGERRGRRHRGPDLGHLRHDGSGSGCDRLRPPPLRTSAQRMAEDMTLAVPPPSGEFAVGRVSRDWTDTQRTDPYAADPSEPRSLVAWVWYPRDRTLDEPAADYLPPAWRPAGDMLGLRTEGLTANSSDGGPVAGARAAYPVVLLSPSGFPPLLLSAIAEDLASHGFVVVGVNHTYETAVTVFADGRTVAMNPAAIAGALGPQSGSHREVFARRTEVCRYKAADLAFVADRLAGLDADDPLTGRLDLSRLTAIGHSFGGAAALQWCRDDPRCVAAANLDGALWSEVGRSGLARPVLQLLAPHHEFDATPDEAVTAGMAPDPDWFAAEKAITFGGWETVDRTGRPAYSLQIIGATHLSFMDVPFLPVGDDSPARGLLAATAIDPARMREVMTTVLVAFLATGDIAGASASEVVRTTTTPLPRATTGTAGDVA